VSVVDAVSGLYAGGGLEEVGLFVGVAPAEGECSGADEVDREAVWAGEDL